MKTPTFFEQQALRDARKKIIDPACTDEEAEKVCRDIWEKYHDWCLLMSDNEKKGMER